MASFTKFVSISKVDKDKRLVTGYASTPALDSDDEVVALEAIKAALPDYMNWGNVRYMHTNHAVGVAKEATMDDKGLLFTAKVVDDDIWNKVLEGVLKGFSIGGTVLAKVGNVITELLLLEISLVDRPANPECRFEMVKSAKVIEGGSIEMVKSSNSHMVVDGADPLSVGEVSLLKRILAYFQKGDHPLDDGSGVVTTPEPTPMYDGPGSPFHSHLLPHHGPNPLAEGAGLKPYGDVEYADPGLQTDGKHRYPVDTEEHIRSGWSYINKPENQTPYSAEHLSQVKDKIVSAWKDKIHADGPPGAEKTVEPMLIKNIDDVAQLSYTFSTLRSVQRSLLFESEIEGDPRDHEFAEEAGELAVRVSSLMAAISSHEGGEAVDLTGEEDILFRQWTGASLAMAIENTNMSKRFSAAFKEHMGKCAGHLEKAVKAHGEATSATRSLKAMINEHATKAAKAAGEAFDHAKALEHIHACSGALSAMEDHHDLAAHHLDKCVKSAGEKGDEGVGGGSNGELDAPGFQKPGELGLHSMTEGEVPDYDPDKPYAGKSAVGAMLHAKMGEVYWKAVANAMGRQPMGPNRAKTFDIGGAHFSAAGGANVQGQQVASIFDGVSSQPRSLEEAQAGVSKAITNIHRLGMGKSVADGNFRGAAGTRSA